MAYQVITLSKWAELVPHHGKPSDYNGPSPGGVAAMLKISRQSVHRAINRGELEAFRVVNDRDRSLVAVVVKPSSIANYQAARALRRKSA